jgi:DNA mismatch repair protein MutS
MVEMAETAHILRQASPDSLVLLDEIGRGTSTQDGLAIASAILEEMAMHVRCYTLFATHFHEIVPFAASLPGVRTVQTEVVNIGGVIRFRHRLKAGAASSSFGIEVAKLAGLPGRVIESARRLVTSGQGGRAPNSSRKKAPPPLETRGLELVPEAGTSVRPLIDSVVERLRGLDINKMTPIQALNVIEELKQALSPLGSLPLPLAQTTCSAGQSWLEFSNTTE